MVSDERLERYADVLVGIGLRVESGDRLLIRSGTHAAPLVRHVARRAYKAGAVNVDVLWIDDEIDRARFLDGSPAAADELSFDPLVLERAATRSDSFLRIVGEAPDRMADLDPERVGRYMRGLGQATSGFFEKQISLGFYWTIAPAPSPEWARLVFPDLAPDDALEALWDAVAATIRIDEADPLAAWESHLDHLDARMAALDEMAFSEIRYDGRGIDLVVCLPDEHRWNHPGEGSRDAERSPACQWRKSPQPLTETEPTVSFVHPSRSPTTDGSSTGSSCASRKESWSKQEPNVGRRISTDSSKPTRAHDASER